MSSTVCRMICRLQKEIKKKKLKLCHKMKTHKQTVYSIFILVINQIDAQNLFYNKFISRLYIFRAPCAHRQEVKIVLYSLW